MTPRLIKYTKIADLPTVGEKALLNVWAIVERKEPRNGKTGPAVPGRVVCRILDNSAGGCSLELCVGQNAKELPEAQNIEAHIVPWAIIRLHRAAITRNVENLLSLRSTNCNGSVLIYASDADDLNKWTYSNFEHPTIVEADRQMFETLVEYRKKLSSSHAELPAPVASNFITLNRFAPFKFANLVVQVVGTFITERQSSVLRCWDGTELHNEMLRMARRMDLRLSLVKDDEIFEAKGWAPEHVLEASRGRCVDVFLYEYAKDLKYIQAGSFIELHNVDYRYTQSTDSAYLRLPMTPRSRGGTSSKILEIECPEAHPVACEVQRRCLQLCAPFMVEDRSAPHDSMMSDPDGQGDTVMMQAFETQPDETMETADGDNAPADQQAVPPLDASVAEPSMLVKQEIASPSRRLQSQESRLNTTPLWSDAGTRDRPPTEQGPSSPVPPPVVQSSTTNSPIRRSILVKPEESSTPQPATQNANSPARRDSTFAVPAVPTRSPPAKRRNLGPGPSTQAQLLTESQASASSIPDSLASQGAALEKAKRAMVNLFDQNDHATPETRLINLIKEQRAREYLRRLTDLTQDPTWDQEALVAITAKVGDVVWFYNWLLPASDLLSAPAFVERARARMISWALRCTECFEQIPIGTRKAVKSAFCPHCFEAQGKLFPCEALYRILVPVWFYDDNSQDRLIYLRIDHMALTRMDPKFQLFSGDKVPGLVAATDAEWEAANDQIIQHFASICAKFYLLPAKSVVRGHPRDDHGETVLMDVLDCRVRAKLH